MLFRYVMDCVIVHPDMSWPIPIFHGPFRYVVAHPDMSSPIMICHALLQYPDFDVNTPFRDQKAKIIFENEISIRTIISRSKTEFRYPYRNFEFKGATCKTEFGHKVIKSPRFGCFPPQRLQCVGTPSEDPTLIPSNQRGTRGEQVMETKTDEGDNGYGIMQLVVVAEICLLTTAPDFRNI